MAGKWDVRLLTASYRREGPSEEPVIEFFGRTRDGKSIAIEFWGFQPYFYCIEPTQTLISLLKKDDEVIDVKTVELEVGREQDFKLVKRRCGKVILHHPWLTPDYREKCRREGSEVLAADIPFPLRFMFDMDIQACFTVHGEEIEGRQYTTDLKVKADKFEPCEPFAPPMKILSFDIENTLKDPHILCLGYALRKDGDIVTDCLSGDEKKIISRFAELVQKEDPDVISGYNIDGYDLPLLLERAEKLGMKQLPLARDGGVASSFGDRFWRCHGRIIADAWWSVKMELKPKQETLDYVARQLLGEGKHEVDRTRMDEEWVKDKEKVMEYCKNDAKLALRILEKLARLDKSMELATVSKLALDDAFNSRTSTLIDSILIREADRNHIGVPMTRTGRTREGIEGGYVHTLNPGLFEWVVTLDFKSMYPSIIIENNICFTTLDPDGAIVSPTGVRFVGKDVREGLLPRILRNLMKERDATKKKMREEKDPEKKEYYRRLQEAIKVLMNAFYGVLASSFYRFTNPEIGGSITAFARQNITSIIQQLESEGVKVLYADTDSVFYQSPYQDLDQTCEHARKIAERFSHGTISMDFEKVMRSFFSHGKKKRYAGKVIWPYEDLVVRGYEIRRTDAFELQSASQMKVFELLLNGDTNGAIELAKDLVARLKSGVIPKEFVPEDAQDVELLVISRSVKEENEYDRPESMSNVQAAQKLRKMGQEVVPGMKVSWIVTDGKSSPQQVEPYVSGIEFTVKPDWEYYARRLAQTLSYVTEVYGWDEKALLTGKQAAKQMSLSHEDFNGGGKKEKHEVKKTDKSLKIEDFF